NPAVGVDRQRRARHQEDGRARRRRDHHRSPRSGVEAARVALMAFGRYVLALDQGTSGSTALVVDAEGRVRARGYAELPQHYPEPGWVEHDPEEIWASVERAAQSALAAAGAARTDIAAIGITNQRETTVVWDRATGRPIHNAIVWQCRRTAPLCDELKAAGLEPAVRQRTGLVIDAYFSGTKIRWLLDHVPDARRRAEAGA